MLRALRGDCRDSRKVAVVNKSVEPVVPDGDRDIAAVVYGGRENPDALMASFAADLIEQGFDAIGVVQQPIAARGGAVAATELLFVPGRSGASLPPCEAAPFPAAIPFAQEWLIAMVQRRPDLVIINRFGSLEHTRGGLLGAVREAVARDIPVVIAVPQALFGEWLRVTRGLAVKLECRRPSLDRWWQSLGRTSVAPTPRDRVCETFR